MEWNDIFQWSQHQLEFNDVEKNHENKIPLLK